MCLRLKRLGVAEKAFLVIEHKQIGLVGANQVIEAFAPAVHKFDVEIKRAQRFIVFLPLAILLDKAREKPLD